MENFGRLVRRLRKEANKTMGDVAQVLGFSVTYISDVERGKRAPWNDTVVQRLADELGVLPEVLLASAAETRGAFELAADVSPAGRVAGAYLAREWQNLTDDDFGQLREWLTKKRSGGGT